MKLKRRNRNHASVDASSLSDILFFLMLFFLMISTMASPSAIKMLLPTSKSQKNIPKQTINLYITADHHYFIENQKVSFESIKTTLAFKTASMDETTVIIRADKTISIAILITVLDIINDLKLQSVIATSKMQ